MFYVLIHGKNRCKLSIQIISTHSSLWRIFMNVFDIAMEKEQEVKIYYEKLAKETSHAGVKNIFMLLAADEQRHFDAVQAIKNEIDYEVPADSPALKMAREVLGEFFGDTVPASNLKKSLDSYRHAMSVEAESVKFYEGILETVKDSGLKQKLTTILSQEREHYMIVENLYEYVLKPEYFLEWAEFSNLRML
ncbi:MAG: ferritin family protein [Geobacteraceae bacterium]|nr:ferritin family protein [Geobacteraceae bacterium]